MCNNAMKTNNMNENKNVNFLIFSSRSCQTLESSHISLPMISSNHKLRTRFPRRSPKLLTARNPKRTRLTRAAVLPNPEQAQ